MTPNYGQFDTKSAKRIANSIKKIENQLSGHRYQKGNYAHHNDGFWAKIYGKTTDVFSTPTWINDHIQNPGYYKWNRVTLNSQIDATSIYGLQAFGTDIACNMNLMPEFSDRYEGDFNVANSQRNFAIEIPYSTNSVICGDIVWLQPSQDYDFFLFKYSPPMRFAKVVDAKIDKAIIAGDTIDYGYGVCRIYEPGIDNYELTLMGSCPDEETDDFKIGVFNGFRSDIAENSIVQITYGPAGRWWVTAVDCLGS